MTLLGVSFARGYSFYSNFTTTTKHPNYIAPGFQNHPIRKLFNLSACASVTVLLCKSSFTQVSDCLAINYADCLRVYPRDPTQCSLLLNPNFALFVYKSLACDPLRLRIYAKDFHSSWAPHLAQSLSCCLCLGCIVNIIKVAVATFDSNPYSLPLNTNVVPVRVNGHCSGVRITGKTIAQQESFVIE